MSVCLMKSNCYPLIYSSLGQFEDHKNYSDDDFLDPPMETCQVHSKKMYACCTVQHLAKRIATSTL